MWLDGKRDGRGTIIFGNGAVYKGRFKEDGMEGQGTLKMDCNVSVSRPKSSSNNTTQGTSNDTSKDSLPNELKDLGDKKMEVDEPKDEHEDKPNEPNVQPNEDIRNDWMIPIEFQSDIGRIHEKAGFTTGGE